MGIKYVKQSRETITNMREQIKTKWYILFGDLCQFQESHHPNTHKNMSADAHIEKADKRNKSVN
jgi:hypothetical protein